MKTMRLLNIRRWLLRALYMFICLLVLSQPIIAYAQQQQYDPRTLTTPFYDPNAVACNNTSNSGPLVGSDNAQKVFNFFVSKGLTAEQAAGITGNGEAESGLNPTNTATFGKVLAKGSGSSGQGERNLQLSLRLEF